MRKWGMSLHGGLPRLVMAERCRDALVVCSLDRFDQQQAHSLFCGDSFCPPINRVSGSVYAWEV